VSGVPTVVIVATRNPGKLSELWPMITAAGFTPLSLADAGIAYRPEEESIEAFGTFAENAVAKARYYLGVAAGHGSGRAVLADDSGLVVNALGGQPGVHSKRWGGDPTLAGSALDAGNNARLIAALEGVRDRRARFVCVAAIAWEGGELTARGETAGEMLHVPRGAHGFGYDPLFLSDDLGVTLAEASIGEKSGVSHRGRAVARALADLRAMQ
jgi:XTP/dITP diphosphohydrolase